VKAWAFKNVICINVGLITHSHFRDGVTNVMHMKDVVNQADYVQVAIDHGYTDPREYNLEHDLTHHWYADWLGIDWSPALHDAALGLLPSNLADAPDSIKSEEHVVNSLQKFTRTGKRDSYGELDRIFGSKLNVVAEELWECWSEFNAPINI